MSKGLSTPMTRVKLLKEFARTFYVRTDDTYLQIIWSLSLLLFGTYYGVALMAYIE